MAKLDFFEYIKKYSNGEAELVMVEFSTNTKGTDASYEYGVEEGKTIIKIDKDSFESADKKVLEALVNNLSPEQQLREKAESLLGEFINREGKYQSLGERENRDELKEIIKNLEGSKLEVLLYTAQILQDDENGKNTKQIYESITNV